MNKSFEELSAQASGLRERINRFREGLGHWFTGRQTAIDLMTVSAVAQEPLLLLGPPGTAKSDLVLKFKDALQINTDDYFEYMLTRFTEPSEIFGPVDIEQLKNGRYLRRSQGKLPEATLVFLDEVFKSNSAILNALLTIINERKFYQDGRAQPVPLKILFAATNHVPDHTELAALRDRFILHVPCDSLPETQFMTLLDTGLAAHTQRDLNQRPWAEGHAKLDDFLMAHRYLSHCFHQVETSVDGVERRDRDRFFPEERMREFRWIIRSLRHEDGLFISDRSIVKLYRLIRTQAWIAHGGQVETTDLQILGYVGGASQEVREKVHRVLGLD
jgi:MoxR-like ATPase